MGAQLDQHMCALMICMTPRAYIMHLFMIACIEECAHNMQHMHGQKQAAIGHEMTIIHLQKTLSALCKACKP